MNTKILICALAAATLVIGSAACGKKKTSGNGAPAFPDPPAGGGIQIDRVGRPAINTIVHKVLDTSATSANAFNGAMPGTDVTAFGAAVGLIVQLIHACPTTAVAGVLLPDVLTFNTTSDGNYAKLNGRALADDVFDDTLAAVYTSAGGHACAGLGGDAGPLKVAPNGTHLPYLGGDGIAANDVAFGTTFPFLAAPH